MNRNRLIVLVIALVFRFGAQAQIDTAFWFAAPWTTPDHWWKDNIVLHLSSFNTATTVVRLRQPAIASGPNKYDTTITLGPNTTFDYVFWRDKLASPTNWAFDSLEVRPADQVLPYGLYISSSSNITVVYDAITRPTNFYNPETFSLKGQNGLGTEFVCPFQTLNRSKTLGGDLNGDGQVTQPKQQINLVATQPNTVVWITPRCNVVNHPANVTYSVLLPFPGSAYTCENLVQNTYVTGNSLSGSVIVSDKPIAVTVGDDSVNSIFSEYGCYDYMGDQIVPVDIVGTDYIVNLGQLYKTNQPSPGNRGMKEAAYIVATDNFTQLTINDGTVTTALLNKGDTYVDTLFNPITYIHASKNVYVVQATGIGCEMGMALLPPLNCAGSNLIAFSRNTPQKFALNILCKNGSQGTFTLNGSTTLVPASAFTIAPGTATLPGGPFYGAQVSLYSTTVLPIGSYTIGNNTDVFALGVMDGDLGTGGLFHYMSSFLRKTVVKTQTLAPICSGQAGTVAVTGTITGADITGIWSTSNTSGTTTIQGGGSGTFSPVYTSTLNTISTIYSVSVNDTTFTAPTRTITLYLTSIGSCKGVTDSVKLVINQRPIVAVSGSTLMCKNNVSPIVLTGSVTNAVSGVWSGGNGGAFGIPGLVSTYTPSSADLAANTITITLTSQGPLAGCPNSTSSFTVGFINPPVVSIVPNNFQVCTNSTTLALNGNISGVTNTGIWLGGTGAYTLTNTSPTATYILSPADLGQSSITLTLSSTNNGICAAESATALISVIAKPLVEVPQNFPTVCAGAGSFVITGTVSGSANQGIWSTSNGSGVFSPNVIQPSPVGVVYFMNQLVDTSGTLTFVLESSGGICPVEKDSFNVTILKPPVVMVNQNFLPVCRNTPIALTGTVSGYTSTGIWSTSSNTSTPGTFTPSPTVLNGFYEPSDADLNQGYVVLTLQSTNNGLCPPSSAAFTASFVPAPKADFTMSSKLCLNWPVLFTSTSQQNGTGFLKYNWDFGDNSPTSTSSAPDPIKTYTAAGQYLVTLTVTGVSLLNVNCPDVKTGTVTVRPLPVAKFSVSPACQNKPAVFTNESYAPPGSAGIVLWEWTFGDKDTTRNHIITGIPTNTVSHSYTASGSYDAVLTVTAGSVSSPSLGCVSEQEFVRVNVFPKPKAEFGLTNNPSVVQEPVYFSDFSTPTGNIAAWFWEFGDEGAATDQAPTHTYQEAGLFKVKLTITDQAGCVDTLSKNIEVSLLPQVPGGFSPNGDGLNDYLFVKGGPFEKMLFRVYNSWGEMLFETSDQKVGWDGKKNGVDQPTGVYVWTMVVDMYNNRQVKKHGDVNIVR